MQPNSRFVGVYLACVVGAGVLACQPELLPAEDFALEERPPVRVPEPVEVPAEGADKNLLQRYVEREPLDPNEPQTWELPFKSKRVVVALLITAAHDRLDDLPLILSPDAMWGLPDTRMLGARPVFNGDDGEAFFDAFRKAAQRFDGDADWVNKPLLPGMQEAVRAGAEPMWGYYSIGPERIYIRQVQRGGRTWIDYVGFFEELPSEPIQLRPELAMPAPMVPPVRRPDGTRQPESPQRPTRDRVEIRERPDQ